MYERENNDSYASATPVTLNNSYRGVISRKDDVDFYKIVAPANGKISLKFCHTYQDSWHRWKIYVYRYVNGSYNELSSDSIELRDNEKYPIPYIGAVKGGIYFVKVYRDSYSDNVIGVNYVLQTAFTASEYFEKEENNVYSTATPVVLNNTYSGVINSSSDKDYYKIVAPKSGKISLKFCHTYHDSWHRWKIYVYRYVNGSYNELSSNSIELRDNEKYTIPYIGAVKGGIYFVKVYRDSYSDNVIGYNYSIKTSMSIPSVTKISATSNAGAVKLSWNRVSGASGYQVQIQKSGKWTNYATTTGTSYTVKSLKAGSAYNFRVCSFINYKGTKYYGSYKGITWATKPVTPTILDPASDKLHRIKAKWKSVAAGSGYYVQVSTDKNFKKSVINQRVSNKASNNCIIKKLKKGARYYVRVRAYKTFGKKRTLSGWSKVKSIVCK